MKGCIEFIVRLIRANRQAYARKWSFLGVFAFVFFGSVVILGRLDLLPQTVSAEAATPTVVISAHQSNPVAVAELPMKIEIPKINLSTIITNPTTTVIAALDKELLKGAVRYPTSAKLGEAGNVVLFGHSSYLPVVGNQAYKAFNDIQKLKPGDTVEVQGEEEVYVYAVRSVSKESADKNTPIPLMPSGKELTLVTCNSFGKKSDRFVVVADFVESHAVPG